MPQLGDRAYTLWNPHQRVLERGRDQRVRQPVYYDGQLVTGLTGTYTLSGPQGTTVATGAVIADSDGAPAYDLTAGVLAATLAYGPDYTEVWTLSLPDNSTRAPRRIVVLARKALDPPIADVDLEGEYPDIVQNLAGQMTSFQSFIDAAWGTILRRLGTEGAWPHQAYDSSAFYEAHLHLTLGNVYRHFFKVTSDPKWMELSKYHSDEYSRAWRGLAVAWDRNEDGKPDDVEDLTGTQSALHRNGAPRRFGAYPRGRY